MQINDSFLQLRNNYLFREVVNRTERFEALHPDKKIIKLGIGDYTLPLPKIILEELHSAVDEYSTRESFHGYGPEDGYSFLKKAIIEGAYKPRGLDFAQDEVFISDGAGSDLGNLCDIFGNDNRVAVLDPVYPAYIDTTVMAGRAGRWLGNQWSDIEYLPCTAENGFVPDLPKKKCDILYLCFPNNPTGTTINKNQLQRFVDYAIQNQTLIVFDGAYEVFIEEDDVPHSIYECEGAREVAIEVRSFSKMAGFTGIRCGYTIVPRELKGRSTKGEEVRLRDLWFRRQCTKFNGTSYIAQKAAAVAYTEEGQKQIMENIAYYKQNARTILTQLGELGYTCFGGINSPYIWLKTPNGMGSWEFFDILLNVCGVVSTPGVGFGKSGDGYVRLTAFGTKENTLQALERIKQIG